MEIAAPLSRVHRHNHVACLIYLPFYNVYTLANARYDVIEVTEKLDEIHIIITGRRRNITSHHHQLLPTFFSFFFSFSYV